MEKIVNISGIILKVRSNKRYITPEIDRMKHNWPGYKKKTKYPVFLMTMARAWDCHIRRGLGAGEFTISEGVLRDIIDVRDIGTVREYLNKSMEQGYVIFSHKDYYMSGINKYHLSNYYLVDADKIYRDLEANNIIIPGDFKDNYRDIISMYKDHLTWNRTIKHIKDSGYEREAGAKLYKINSDIDRARRLGNKKLVKKLIKRKLRLERIIEEQISDFHFKQIEKEKKLITKFMNFSKPYLEMTDNIDTYGLKCRYLREGSSRFYFDRFVSTKNPEKHPGNTDRYDLLKSIWGEDAEIYYYDRPASIHVLETDLFAEKYFYEGRYFYEDVYLKTCEHLCIKPNWCDEVKSEIKLLTNKLTMNPNGPLCMSAIAAKAIKDGEIYDTTKRKYIEKYIALEDIFKSGDISLFVRTLYYYIKKTKRGDERERKNYRKNGDITKNNCLGKEIFIHESNVYIHMLYELQKMGYRLLTLYDCFYFDNSYKKVDEEVINDVYKQCVKDYRKRLRNMKLEELDQKLKEKEDILSSLRKKETDLRKKYNDKIEDKLSRSYEIRERLLDLSSGSSERFKLIEELNKTESKYNKYKANSAKSLTRIHDKVEKYNEELDFMAKDYSFAKDRYYEVYRASLTEEEIRREDEMFLMEELMYEWELEQLRIDLDSEQT